MPRQWKLHMACRPRRMTTNLYDEAALPGGCRSLVSPPAMHPVHSSVRTRSDVERSVVGVVTGVDGAASRQEALQQLRLPGGDCEVQRRATLLQGPNQL